MQSEKTEGDFTDSGDLSFSFSFFLFQKFCKKDTTSVFHKDINVYTPATQKE